VHAGTDLEPEITDLVWMNLHAKATRRVGPGTPQESVTCRVDLRRRNASSLERKQHVSPEKL
jgi:hypothetical protein